MGILSHFFYPWGLILQGLAIIHFIRRRPDTYWIYVILFLGPIGATVYLFAEALPDIGLARHSLKGFSRRKRIGQLQIAIRDNPSTGNYEELGDLYLEEGKLQPRARCLRQGRCRPRQYDRSVLRTRSLRDPVR